MGHMEVILRPFIGRFSQRLHKDDSLSEVVYQGRSSVLSVQTSPFGQSVDDHRVRLVGGLL